MGATQKVDQQAPSQEVLDHAVRVLREGGVLVMPTDSVYGIGCVATSGNPGHGRIFAIKHRNRAQTLPWLVSDPSDLQVYGHDVPAWMGRLAHELWPGALTLVVEASDVVPPEYRAAYMSSRGTRYSMRNARLCMYSKPAGGSPISSLASQHGLPSKANKNANETSAFPVRKDGPSRASSPTHASRRGNSSACSPIRLAATSWPRT